MSARLVGIAGPLAGSVLELRGETTIGRQEGNAIVVEDLAVSRRHCVIRREDEGFRIVDLESRHGTFVNGARVTSRILEHQDRIVVGDSELAFLDAVERRSGEEAPVAFHDLDLRGTPTQSVRSSDANFVHPERILPTTSEAGRRRVATLDALVRVAAAVASARETPVLARTVLEELFTVVPAERGALVLRDEPADLASEPARSLAFALGLRRSARSGATSDAPVRFSRTVAARVMQDNAALLAEGVAEDPEWDGAPSLREARVQSLLCVPIALFDRVIGAIVLDTSDGHARFDETHLQVATAIAGIAALPLATSRAAAARADVAPTPSPASAPPAGAVVLLPDEPLHLGRALALRAALSRLPSGASKTALLLDYGRGVAQRKDAALPATVLDRLALLPEDAGFEAALATDVPSLARLAALVASTLETGEKARAQDGRAWFRSVLLTTALLVTRAGEVVVEEEDPDESVAAPSAFRRRADFVAAGELLLARRLAGRVDKLLPGRCAAPAPVLSGLAPFDALDGSGRMGISPRGTILLTDAPEVVLKKIRSAKSDARPHFDPAAEISPEVRNLLALLHALTDETMASLCERFAGKGYGVMKGALADAAESFLAPVRARRARLAADAGLAEALRRRGEALDAEVREVAEALSRAPEALAEG